MIQKLFGGKGKKKDFFLEINKKQETDSKTDNKTEDKVETPQAKPQTEAKPSKTEGSDVAEKETSEVKAPKKDKKAKTTAQKKKAKEAPKAEPVTTATTNGAKPQPQPEPKEVEFATKYLITPSLSRRRPGPSLSSFKAMARQVKSSRS